MSLVKRISSTETKCSLFSETLIVVKEEQQENSHPPIDVIPSEIFTSLIDSLIEYQETYLSSLKFTISPLPSMVRTPFENVAKQFSPHANGRLTLGGISVPLMFALKPIDSIVDGRNTFSNFSQFENAKSPMEVIPSLNFILLT